MTKLFGTALLSILPLAAQVQITQGQNRLDIAIDGKPYTTFFYGPEAPKTYLSPLRAPSGTVVTRGYPMEKIAGESTDHPHHRGLWFAHSDVNGYDYWNNEFSYEKDPRYKGKLGHIYVTKINKVESGKNTGEIDETSEWKQLDGKVVLMEDRKMVFHAGGPNRVIDLDFTLTAKEPVKFGDAKDGVFGIRLASGLEEPGPKSIAEPKRTGLMTSSRGCKTEKECWGSRAEWMDYSGTVEGDKLGIAILDNPHNPGFPTYWHARGYGLFANNIFARHEFTKGAEPDGSVSLKPGEKIHFSYRVVVHEGDANEAKIADVYAAWAK